MNSKRVTVVKFCFSEAEMIAERGTFDKMGGQDRAARRGRGTKFDDSYALRALGGQMGDAPEAGFRS